MDDARQAPLTRPVCLPLEPRPYSPVIVADARTRCAGNKGLDCPGNTQHRNAIAASLAHLRLSGPRLCACTYHSRNVCQKTLALRAVVSNVADDRQSKQSCCIRTASRLRSHNTYTAKSRRDQADADESRRHPNSRRRLTNLKVDLRLSRQRD